MATKARVQITKERDSAKYTQTKKKCNIQKTPKQKKTHSKNNTQSKFFFLSNENKSNDSNQCCDNSAC